MKCDACDYFASPDHCCVESRSVKPCPEIRTCDKFKYEAGVGEIVRLELKRERERCAKICEELAAQMRRMADQSRISRGDLNNSAAAVFDAQETAAGICARRIRGGG